MLDINRIWSTPVFLNEEIEALFLNPQLETFRECQIQKLGSLTIASRTPQTVSHTVSANAFACQWSSGFVTPSLGLVEEQGKACASRDLGTLVVQSCSVPCDAIEVSDSAFDE